MGEPWQGGNAYESSEEFLRKMDQGLLNGHLFEEIRKLSVAQLHEVALVLSQRSLGLPDNSK
jgi:hypothetical protein